MRDCLIMVFADAHLDDHIWAGRRDIRGDSKAAFAYLVNRAIAVRPQWLVCAGDMLDSREPSSAVIAFLCHQLKRLADAKVSFGFVLGNHDYTVPPWAAALRLGNVQHLHARAEELENGLVMRGLDWRPAELLDAEMGMACMATQLLICHQAWAEFMGDSRAEGSLQASVRNGVQTVVTGDFHECHLRKELNVGAEEITVISPGSTHIRSISEPTEHFYFTLHSDGQWRKRRLPGRPILRDKLEHESSFDRFLDRWEERLAKLTAQAAEQKVAQAIAKPLVIIDFASDLPQAAHRLRKRIGDDAFLISRSYKRPTEEEEAKEAIDKQQRQELLSGGLVVGLHQRLGQDHPNYGPLRRLLEASEMEAELATMKQERGL